MNSKKLHLGCGHQILPGWINVDRVALPGVDLVLDLEKAKLPFADASMSEVQCQDLLEHLDYLPLLKEIHRVLLPGGSVWIQVPHFTSRDNYIDPTHRRQFSVRTFDHFISDNRYQRNYYFDFAFARILQRRITFLKRFPFCFNALIELLINAHLRLMDLYELTFLSALFPAWNIQVRLIK